MNPLLQVKLRFSSEPARRPGPRNLRTNAYVDLEKIDSLVMSLRAVLRYYRSIPKIISNYVIDIKYNDIIAKSNRVQEIFRPVKGSPNDLVVGARFSDDLEGSEKHVITYYVGLEIIEETLAKLALARKYIAENLGNKATKENFNEPGCSLKYDGYGETKSAIRSIIVDCSVIEAFAVPGSQNVPDRDSFLVTFYKTELSLATVLEKLHVSDIQYQYSFYGDNTISLSKDLFYLLNEKVPYLISMVSSDFSRITLADVDTDLIPELIEIPEPTNEPTIGVIDTLFYENVYFSKWVENNDYLDEFETSSSTNEPRIHGTEVSSIIVDGPRMNPWLDDGCGRFRVRHFGVCANRISTGRLVRKIREIVAKNPDIHVWNLSLGTEDEVSKNFISFDAAFLDEIQAQKNTLFVISGTNDTRADRENRLRVGSPADSLNSIVVNSVKRNGSPASYSRRGKILSFFNKPDVSYYGGDYDERIKVYSPCGEEEEYGTSFAAPWISRKLCYLIDVIGLPREVAKALIIDAAAGWEFKELSPKERDIVGYGIVPISIENVLYSDSSEIRFFLYGTSSSYKTSNYSIPIPKDDTNKYPFISRVVLCYFPECSRSQGVDYTNRELSINFGRVKPDGTIDDINENVQDRDDTAVDERKSRAAFRKWENTKIISQIIRKNRPIKAYGDQLWGFSVISKERLRSSTGYGLNFGAVITLREVNGINRIQEFIHHCTLRGWIVNEIDLRNQIDVYNFGQEELLLD